MVQNGDILLQKVFVPDEDWLPGINSFQDTNKVQFNGFHQMDDPFCSILLFLLGAIIGLLPYLHGIEFCL